MVVVKKPVEINCSQTAGSKGCRGVMWRISLSRLEEGLGHEGFECSKCKRRVKYVPKQ